MNKKEGNQKYITAFMIVLIVVIAARYLIHKIRPGTFSIITFQIINTKELILLTGCALLLVTEKLKYYKINLGVCAALFSFELIQYVSNPEIRDYHYAILVLPVIATILLMIYPIKKWREKRTESNKPIEADRE